MAKKKRKKEVCVTTGWPFSTKEESEKNPTYVSMRCCLCGAGILAPRRGFGGPLRACVPCIEELGKGLGKPELPS